MWRVGCFFLHSELYAEIYNVKTHLDEVCVKMIIMQVCECVHKGTQASSIGTSSQLISAYTMFFMFIL